MAALKTIFVALLAVPAALAAPAPHTYHIARGAPQTFSGPASSFPAMSTWVDFNTTLSNNAANMEKAGSSATDVTNIGAAVQAVAPGANIDPRVILALIIQESMGNVGVATTTNVDGKSTGGLMQTQDCQGYPGQKDLLLSEITGMVKCGVDHFAKNLEAQGGQNTVDSIYPALRVYNSGSVVLSDLGTAPNGAGVPTYVSDIAQRLQGEVF